MFVDPPAEAIFGSIISQSGEHLDHAAHSYQLQVDYLS
jgi:hypothetical protein